MFTLMVRCVDRVRRREDGLAMVIAVVLSGVIATLAILMLSIGTHTDSATARGRHWVQSLHVAESGVEHAIVKLQSSDGVFTGTFSGATDEGEYDVTVTRGARNVYTIESVGGVRQGQQLGATRSIRVTMAPPSTFKNAIFSFTSLDTKNNDIIEGDAWANENLILADNTHVTGSVTAATGYLFLHNGASVDGDAQSGGFDAASPDKAIFLDNNATIGGNATASVTAPPDPVTCGGASPSDYKVDVDTGASVGGNVKTWGTKSGAGTVGGTIADNVCTSSPATMPMPVYSYSADNYPAATLHEFGTPSAPSATAVADFHTWLNAQPGKRMQGTFYLNQQTPVNQGVRVNLTGAVITGDTTIVTNTPIFTNGTTDDTTDAIVFLGSFYRPPTGSSCDVNNDNSECAVHLKNNFNSSGATAIIVYSPYGPTAIKNNAVMFGAIYGDSVQVKNNQEMTYDARVERVIGFGPTHLEITRWLEL